MIRKIINRLARCVKFLIYTRPVYTIWFNFRYLPFSIARKLPVIFFPHAFAKVEKGAKIIIGDEILNHKSSKVYVGEDVRDFAHFSEKTYLHIAGTVVFNGKIHILRGAFIDAWGTINFGDNVLICSLTRIRAYNSIVIGNHTAITHETQIFDTNFHYVTNVEAMEYRPMSKPLIIGDYVWICNRSTITRGSIIPSHTIVASNSLVNKDLSYLNPYTIVGGMPCKVLAEGKARVWDNSLESKYFKQEFGYLLKSENPVIW